MSYTDKHGTTLDYDIGGGPDAWEVMQLRITAPGEQDATVDMPLEDAALTLTRMLAEVTETLAAQKNRLPDPLAHGGQVTHIIHTVEGISFTMDQDEGIVWETRLGWQIQWQPAEKKWRVRRPSGRSELKHMDHWARALGQDHYPILGITVAYAPKVIHDGDLEKLPQSPHYRYRTNRGLIIEWDTGRGKFIVSPEGANIPPEAVEYWPPERLAGGLAPNQFPIRRIHR